MVKIECEDCGRVVNVGISWDRNATCSSCGGEFNVFEEDEEEDIEEEYEEDSRDFISRAFQKEEPKEEPLEEETNQEKPKRVKRIIGKVF